MLSDFHKAWYFFVPFGVKAERNVKKGGQFLRAYVEKYNSPPVNNLITFGSQHMGISDLPVCGSWDVFCQIARRATKRAVYEEWAQTNLVQVCKLLKIVL